MHLHSFISFVALAVALVEAGSPSGPDHGLNRLHRRAKVEKHVVTTKKTYSSKTPPKSSKGHSPAPAPVHKAPAPAPVHKSPAPAPAPAPVVVSGQPGNVWSGTSKWTQSGRTGVSAMQLTVVDENSVVILDKSEHNPLQVAGHPAWGQWMNLATGKSSALNLLTNSFCGGGAFLSNGTLVSFGGNPTTSQSQFDDGNGIQAIRIFPNCNDNGCQVYENPSRIRLTSPRWYGSGCRLEDGSVFIAGGMTAGGFNNVPATDNPTVEFYPPKNINNGLQIYSPFLHDALNSNLFPIMYSMPDGRVFMAANTLAQLYNWETGAEQRLPNLPMRVTYPWSAASTLLPLTPANNYTPTMLFCGGSVQNDALPAYDYSSQMATVGTCATMELTAAGIAAGWQTQDSLPEGRTMGEAVLMPDGKVFIVNGAHTGCAGYGNVRKLVGASNADNPILRPILYDPTAPAGQRVLTKFPSSSVPRMYHSTATLLPDGRVMIAGSNPNADVSNVKYQTEYRIEYFYPPYWGMVRPTFSGLPGTMAYNAPFTLTVNMPAGTTQSEVTVSLMDLGYHTHGVAMDMRLVELVVQSLSGNQLTVVGPPGGNIFPPGVGFVFVLANGVPSKGQKVLVGGQQPPTDNNALANMLDQTSAITRLASIASGKVTQAALNWDPDHPVLMDEGGN